MARVLMATLLLPLRILDLRQRLHLRFELTWIDKVRIGQVIVNISAHLVISAIERFNLIIYFAKKLLKKTMILLRQKYLVL